MTKTKSKFISSQGYNPLDPKCFEHVEGKSMTVSGESYTVQELFERHMQGQVVNIQRESYYEDTADFDAIDFQRLKFADPFEKAEMLEIVAAKAKQAKQAIEAWKKEQEFLSDEDDDSSSSPPPKEKSKSKAKRGGEASDKERSDAERANSPSDDNDE